MNKRKYPPGPEIETIERLMKKRDDLQEENKLLRKLLRRCKKILEHAPEFPFYLIAKYDIEDLQDELAEELSNE